MVSTGTSGWSPSATRTASASSGMASKPVLSELDNPRSGAGFTTRVSARHAIAASTAARVRTEDDDHLLDPGLGERVEHVLEDGPAADRGKQLPAPEARARAGCQDQSDRPHSHVGIFPPARGQGTVALVGGPSTRRHRRPSAEGDPRMTDDQEPTPTAPIGTAAVVAAWSGLDQMAQLVVGGSIAAIVLTILGLPFGTWDSTDFVLLVAGGGGRRARGGDPARRPPGTSVRWPSSRPVPRPSSPSSPSGTSSRSCSTWTWAATAGSSASSSRWPSPAPRSSCWSEP